MRDVALTVGGLAYRGWESIRITRSLEALAGVFEVQAHDRWSAEAQPLPIRDEDACTILVDGQTLIDGYVDHVSLAVAANTRSMTYGGKDKAAGLVECSILPGRWSWKHVDLRAFAAAIAEPFGISVSVDPAVTLPAAPRKLVAHPGDTAFAAIERAARAAGCLLVSDGAGGLLITRGGTARASVELVEGRNILAASCERDASQRFRTYIALAQIPGTDQAAGDATRIEGAASDTGVRRTERIRVVLPGSGMTRDYAQRRADWEARIAAARARTVSVTVRGWLEGGDSGDLWALNKLVPVRSPSIQVDGDMLVSGVEFTLAEGAGETTTLTLVRPDAYTPEPTAQVKSGGAGSTRWDELAGGV